MKLFYIVNIQREVTDNNAVFSEDCKGSVWKSWEGGDEVDNMSRLSNLGKQFAVCAIDDFINVKTQSQFVRHRVVELGL